MIQYLCSCYGRKNLLSGGLSLTLMDHSHVPQPTLESLRRAWEGSCSLSRSMKHEFKLLFKFPITAVPRMFKNPTLTFSWETVMLLNLKE